MKSDNNSHLIPIEHNQTVCAECSVRRLALFHGVPEKDLDWTQAYRAGQYTVKARREIFRESKPCDYMFTLYHGWVAIYKTLDNGKRQILRIALPGDMLGFQSQLTAPMSYSAMTLTDSVLCAFPRDAMPDLLRKNQNVAKSLTELNARDMNICHSRLLTIGQQSAIERIAFFCAELFYRNKRIYNSKDNHEIYFPLSQEDIGDATGLTKIHVNRTLKSMREQGLMRISSRTLNVPDIDKLSQLGGFDQGVINVYALY